MDHGRVTYLDQRWPELRLVGHESKLHKFSRFFLLESATSCFWIRRQYGKVVDATYLQKSLCKQHSMSKSPPRIPFG